MFKILKLFLLAVLSGSIYGATDTTPLLSDENKANQETAGIYQFDICKLPDGLSWPWRILRWPLKSCMYLFKDSILNSTKYVASEFKFNPNAPVYGLENKRGTCYANALFQALKASPKFVSFIGDMASKEEKSRIEFPLAKSLKLLFDDMDKPNAGINNFEHPSASFLRDGFKTDPNVPIHFLKNMESMHYTKIAASMVSVAEEIEDNVAKNSIIKVGNNLVSKRGGASEDLFASLWCALNAESQKITQEGIVSHVAGVISSGSKELWLSEFGRVENNGKCWFGQTNSSYVSKEPPAVLVSHDIISVSDCEYINTADPEVKYDVSLYKLVAIVVHYHSSFFSTHHRIATVLGSDENWYITNDEFVFFVGPNPGIPSTTEMFATTMFVPTMFVYELREIN